MPLILESFLAWIQDKPQYHHLEAVTVQTTNKVKLTIFTFCNTYNDDNAKTSSSFEKKKISDKL